MNNHLAHLPFFIGLLLLAVSCQMEEPIGEQPEALPPQVEYVNVGLKLVGSSGGEHAGTKSVLGTGCEDIKRIIAFAFGSDGNILKYGANAGSLSGQNIVLKKTEAIDTWTLPTGTAMELCVIANPTDVQYDDPSFVNTITCRDDLDAAVYSCTKAELAGIAANDLGIPKAGTLAVASGDISTDDCSLIIPLKNLFAKYSLSFDLSQIPQGCKVEPRCLKLYNSNTRLPYFTEDYCQSSSTYLKEFDYATADDLSKLAKGKAVTVYAMENCHGLKTGAGSWKTISADLAGWSHLPYCTKMLVDVDIDGVTQSYVVYLGAGDMKTDFNVRRNIYKEIRIRLRPGHEAGTSFFEFDQDLAPLTVVQGGSISIRQLFEENIYKYISGNNYLDFRFLNSDERECEYFTVLSSDYMHQHKDFELSCTASTPVGDYWLEGGHFSDFSFDGTTHPAVRDRIRVKVVENISVDFTRTTAAADIYPFLPVTFESTGEYTEAKANSIISGISFTSLDSNTLRYELSKLYTGTGWKVILNLYPAAPGSVGTQSFTFNGVSKNIAAFTVLTPQIRVTGSQPVVVNLDGSSTNVDYTLVKSDGQTELDYEGISGLSFSVNLTNSSNIDFGKGVSALSANPSQKRLALSLKSFNNLSGFTEDSYSFSGYTFTINTTMNFVGPGGLKYQATSSIPGVINNPCAGWDGATYTYRVDQGSSIPSGETYVTSSFSDGKSWHPEYLLEWPARTFSVDLSRGGTRTGISWSACDVWTEYSAFPTSLTEFVPNSSGKVSFAENLSNWGTLYYGKIITNTQSGETRKFAHSIVRVYDHFNIFATLKVREDSHVGKGSLFDSAPEGNPYYNVESWTYGNTGYAALKILAAYIHTIQAIQHLVISFGLTLPLSTLNIITAWTIALSDSQTGVLDVSLKHNLNKSSAAGRFTSYLTRYTPDHINAFDGQITSCNLNSDNSMVETINVAGIAGNCDDALAVLGYEPGSSALVYHIISDKVSIVRGMGGECVGVPNWRRLMAQNEPWYKVRSTTFYDNSPYTGGGYIFYSAPIKVSDGVYNISISKTASGSSSPDKQKFLDDRNLGYHYMHLFWEGKKGKYAVKATHLNPRTDHGTELNAILGDYSVTLANGWYDPTPYYEKGLPIIGAKVGKYFFPESDDSASRIVAGDISSQYYPDELPWKTDCWSTKMETDLTNDNTTDSRDINAYHKYLGGGKFE